MCVCAVLCIVQIAFKSHSIRHKTVIHGRLFPFVIIFEISVSQNLYCFSVSTFSFTSAVSERKKIPTKSEHCVLCQPNLILSNCCWSHIVNASTYLPSPCFCLCIVGVCLTIFNSILLIYAPLFFFLVLCSFDLVWQNVLLHHSTNHLYQKGVVDKETYIDGSDIVFASFSKSNDIFMDHAIELLLPHHHCGTFFSSSSPFFVSSEKPQKKKKRAADTQPQ